MEWPRLPPSPQTSCSKCRLRMRKTPTSSPLPIPSFHPIFKATSNLRLQFSFLFFSLNIWKDLEFVSDNAGISPMLGKRCVSFDEVMNEDELSDDGSAVGEKKKRLNIVQVRTLERNFELGNKLEPERKVQLAKTLGLRPRQVAIWFQNRRARSKTKQLEKDYDMLKRQFEAMRTENDSLLDQNEKLQAEISALRGRETPYLIINLNKETEGSCSNRSENSSEINLEISRRPAVPSHPILPSLRSLEQADMGQLPHNPCKPEFQCPKLENDSPETNFSSFLCNMGDDQSVFWPWPDHHSFH